MGLPPFVEFREVAITEPLRQGDVLEAVGPQTSMWKRHLLVITADCDFAFAKHEGRVTCVPFLTKEEYILEMQVPKLRERLAGKPVAEFVRLLAKAGAPNVTLDRAREWVSEASSDEILGGLALTDAEVTAAGRAIASISLIDSPKSSVAEARRTFVDALLAGPEPPREQSARNQVDASLKSPFVQTPGDALFISALSDGNSDGYFAYLRHIEQVFEPAVSIGAVVRDVQYRRISRLKDRFTLALVQRFAEVFTAIGLPREYEEMRDLHAEFLGEAP